MPIRLLANIHKVAGRSVAGSWADRKRRDSGQIGRYRSALRQTLMLLAFALLPGLELEAQPIVPSDQWQRVPADAVQLDGKHLEQARQYALSAGGSGMIIRGGKLVEAWGDLDRTYDLKSTSKSIGITALGLALHDGKIRLEDLARDLHPSLAIPPESNAETGWIEKITVLHLATQTAGFAKPGGYEPLLFEPGTAWHYSDGGPNWLAECVTLAYRCDIERLLFERIFSRIGIESEDLRWRPNAYRDHQLNGWKRCEFGSGVHANVDAMARIGLLYLREGRWGSEQLLSSSFVQLVRRVHPQVQGIPVHVEGRQMQASGVADADWQASQYGKASDHYGLLWWNNQDGTLKNVPRDVYWSWGLYDSLIVVIPSLDMVAVRAGRSWPRREGARHYDVLAPFLEPIVAAARSGPENELSKAPYPSSDKITGIQWQAADKIIRLAEGSDNWPITWADDDAQYTAYGDGWGFEPRTERKLSLGLARITGSPGGNLKASNIRSPFEQLGQGGEGQKASGMLSLNGVLYMWIRNADNSQLAWSDDYGRTWERSDWKFETSFGCPTFLNAGRDYADAQDDFVYVYSADSDSAYEAADRMVLARVPREQLLRKDKYEFFAGMDGSGDRSVPNWTFHVSQRAAVFEHPGRCFRSGISYCKPLKKYLWCQTLPESQDDRGPRFEGGLGIYESTHPWGPWRTVYFSEHWDVGPGETSSFPCKWIDDQGREAYLLFSGQDCFSLRKATFITESLP